MKIDTDPENMLERIEPARVFHNETKRRFDLSDILVLGVINERDPDGVFNPETLRRIYELTESIKTLRWWDEEHPERTAGLIEVDMVAPSLVDHMSQGGPGTHSSSAGLWRFSRYRGDGRMAGYGHVRAGLCHDDSGTKAG